MTATVAMGKGPRPFVVLLAEDEPADAHLVKLALNGGEDALATDVHHLVDGREALEYLRRQGERFATAVRPDLILLDLNMPRMDGREFLLAIKRDPALRDIPVVVLSTSEVDRDRRETDRLGAAGYIAKPLDVAQFITEIRRLIGYWMALARRSG